MTPENADRTPDAGGARRLDDPVGTDPAESGTTDPSTEERADRGSWWDALKETVVVAVLALLFAFLIKTFLVQAFFIPSGSMENTLEEGDRILVNKLSPTPFEVERGDVVVFQDPGGWLPASTTEKSPLYKAGQFVGVLPGDGDEYLIKRVIAEGGDEVACCDAQGRVTVNGAPLEESYVYEGDVPSLVEFDETVPADHVWVMGDHRSNSGDSRFNGPVPMDRVTGTAFVVIWPFNHLGTLPDGGVFDDVKSAG
ncbi:signal peptidase I [Kytococcus aerolatus]|uniref:Signal peptidase I n=1 Tax=Kytococcus aerolatus TaxID=592308 RepID=A0A212U249_9MICO|nr:signal peptidase I [Kytococcus aerolatus]SNC72206.1 signal peptidase I [Kytococcus aerolatus]